MSRSHLERRPPEKNDSDSRLVTVTGPNSTASTGYGCLRANSLCSQIDAPTELATLTGLTPKAGKSTGSGLQSWLGYSVPSWWNRLSRSNRVASPMGLPTADCPPFLSF